MSFLITEHDFITVEGSTEVTVRSMISVIRQHHCKPEVDGNYFVTEEMLGEALALDKEWDAANQNLLKLPDEVWEQARANCNGSSPASFLRNFIMGAMASK